MSSKIAYKQERVPWGTQKLVAAESALGRTKAETPMSSKIAYKQERVPWGTQKLVAAGSALENVSGAFIQYHRSGTTSLNLLAQALNLLPLRIDLSLLGFDRFDQHGNQTHVTHCLQA